MLEGSLLSLILLLSCEGEGEFYVLLDGEGGDEVEELEDEAYVVEPHVGEFVVFEVVHGLAEEFDLSFVGLVEEAYDLEEGGFSDA